MSKKLPEGVRIPPVDRSLPKTTISASLIKQRKIITGNAGKRQSRSHAKG